jgi:transcriptional regulator with PAS, ATPase and Fis domain
MHIVGKTGVPEVDHPHRIMGQDMVVQRIPIEMDGKLIAVYGQVMFKDVRDVHTLARKLNVLESKVELYEKELESLRSSKYTINNIVGKSERITELKKLALKAAKTHSPVLLIGKRDRKGALRPRHPLCQQSASLSFYPAKLRGYPKRSLRSRAFWL